MVAGGYHLHWALLLLICSFVSGTPIAMGQQPPAKPVGSSGAGAVKVPAPPSAAPAPEQALVLIRSTLLALHQANLTGNYTVFRDLAHSSFQTPNSAAKLGIAFTQLRETGVDLSRVLLETPILSEPIVVAANGKLTLNGQFNTSPQVNFQLGYQFEGGRWRYDKVSVSTQPRQDAPPGQTPASDKINKKKTGGGPAPK